jgi:hypothetical protein
MTSGCAKQFTVCAGLSITSVSLDKLYQGSRNFSEQKFRFPWHKMKFTINWLFCQYRSNQHRPWTVLHSHLSYWWTVILSNWKNGKNTHNTTKTKVHIVYFFKLVICPVVRVFPHGLCWFDLYWQNNQLIVNFILCQGNLNFCSEKFLEPWYNLSSETEVKLWKPEMWIHISVETKFFS